MDRLPFYYKKRKPEHHKERLYDRQASFKKSPNITTKDDEQAFLSLEEETTI
jgi:hypothetical protein